MSSNNIKKINLDIIFSNQILNSPINDGLNTVLNTDLNTQLNNGLNSNMNDGINSYFNPDIDWNDNTKKILSNIDHFDNYYQYNNLLYLLIIFSLLFIMLYFFNYKSRK
jgi:hypothetical protein